MSRLFTFVFLCAFCLSSFVLAVDERIPNFRISNAELKNFVTVLHDADSNQARKDQISLNYQAHTSPGNKNDDARAKLFNYVDPSLLRKPTYAKFLALTDNYDRQTGRAENETPAEKAEITSFLTAVLESDLWKQLYTFLKDKGHPFAADPTTFRRWIAQLWFVPYSRARGKLDTSGFEHTFMGEAKNGEVGGMHSWLRFYTLEKDSNNRFDYKGFVVKRFNVLAAVKYGWQNEWKKAGSFLIGTSPEFDMALYTLCFLSRRGSSRCQVELNGCPMSITSYDLKQRGRIYIGSVYPSAGRLTSQCRQLNSAGRRRGNGK